jgi:RNA polymerase sigma factor (sigma-70 family)
MSFSRIPAMAMPELSGPASPKTFDRATLLGDPALRSALVRFVRGRAGADDVEDIVQQTLTDALAAASAPESAEELRRWVHGIARNKIADQHRRAGREIPREEPPPGEAAAESAPVSARDLLRWAESELPRGDDAQNTLEWMLREGDGEKLEQIAEEANLPAPRVRQRVSRLRRHFKSRWTAQLAAVAALAGLVLLALAIWRKLAEPSPTDIAREEIPEPTPEQRADQIRLHGLELCAKQEWNRCLQELDRAREMDRIQQARAAAGHALAPPSPAPTPLFEEPAPKPEPRKQAPAPAPKAPPKPMPKAPNSMSTESAPPPPPPQYKKSLPDKGSSDFK